MLSIMFDIDGTLIDSFTFDELCFSNAVISVLGPNVDTNWSSYTHITDRGLLMELLAKLGREAELESIERRVKARFLEELDHHLGSMSAIATLGAFEFLEELRSKPGVNLSIATGGWQESAALKLESAGLNVQGIPMATSNDHFKRTEIMLLAKKRSGQQASRSVYFGDAEWDQRACEELGFEFVLIGDRIVHPQQFKDFSDIQGINEILGLPL